jgi:hypothetical protein
MRGRIPRRRGFAFVALAVIGLGLTATGPAQGVGVVHDYPGPAPCATTLQACIDGAASGDTIRIVTDTPIHEGIMVEKSLELTAGAGFHPVIGAAPGEPPADQFVWDVGEGAIDVTVSKIEFRNTRVRIYLQSFAGSEVTMQRNEIFHRFDSNNDFGVFIDLRASGTRARVIDNSIRTTGSPVKLFTDMPESDDSTQVDLVGNRLSTSQATNAGPGVALDLRGDGHVTVQTYSNVIHHASGCNCGNAGAIQLTTLESVEAEVNMVGNTIDRTQGPGVGISIQTPGGTSELSANIFDNIVTAGAGSPIELPALMPRLHVRNGYNDFFGNADPPFFGGYLEGGSTMSVPPGYVNAAAADYRLRSTSPLRDVGLTCTPGGLSRRDAGNRFRVGARNVDIGAFELESGPVPAGVNLFGTDGPNTLSGTPGADVICGMLGGDTINGAGGADHVYGGQGGDEVAGAGGADFVTGGSGPDTITGGLGADHLDGRDHHGTDSLAGGPNTDACQFDPGDSVTGCP